MDRWSRPNGLDIARVRTPIGVIGMIYESRPNVTADAAAICVRSGNAVILRPGSDALRSALAIHAALAEGLAQAGLPAACAQIVPTPDRRSEEHTSELQSLMRISYAVFCLKKKTNQIE